MKVYNRHDRRINTTETIAGSILNSLSGSEDRLWPHENWPPMQLDAPLGEGARGGHGPVRYRVEQFIPGRKAVFRFEPEGLIAGFEGVHYFEVSPGSGCVVMTHVIDARCSFGVWARWRLLIEPIHDAVIEDAFDKVENGIAGRKEKSSPWSPWVKVLREMRARKRRREERKRGV
ncbi:MAG: SRPBCC family protein [Syntrophaceae bacterium]